MTATETQELLAKNAAETKEWQDLITKIEPLHPDLVWHMDETPGLGKVLKHPLVFSVPYCEFMNAMINRQYEYKKQYIADCITKKDWSQYIFMHERPYRAEALLRIANKLTDTEYWNLLGRLWTDSENVWQNYLLFKKLLRSKRLHKEHLMDEDERKVLAKLPDEVRVFRGHTSKNKRGMSWSVNMHTATWFSTRFGEKQGGVVTGLVSKDKIQALFMGRCEFEAVIDPKDVREQKPFTHVLKLTDPLQKVFADNWSQAPLRYTSRTQHGLHHWFKVDYNGIILAGLTPGADLEVIRLFAAFHDSQRVNENRDSSHGKRAAQYVQQQAKAGAISLNSEQLGKLVEACLYHEKGKVSADPTIGACWDADRLDLVRVGVVPKTRLLSTAAGKSLVCKI